MLLFIVKIIVSLYCLLCHLKSWGFQHVDCNLALAPSRYVFTGEVGAARYYHDRMVRGKSESEQSIIRKLSNDNAHSRYEKRKLQKPPQDECLLFAGGGGGAGAASSPRPPLYSKSEEALTSKVRPCTPIHTLEMADLPSPRGKGKGDNKMYNLLPFYQEQTADAKD